MPVFQHLQEALAKHLQELVVWLQALEDPGGRTLQRESRQVRSDQAPVGDAAPAVRCGEEEDADSGRVYRAVAGLMCGLL